MIAKIEALLNEIKNLKAESLEEIESFRIQYLGKKGRNYQSI